MKVTIFKASLTLEIFCISKEEMAGLTASDNSSGLNFLSDKLDKASKIFFKSLIDVKELILVLQIEPIED